MCHDTWRHVPWHVPPWHKFMTRWHVPHDIPPGLGRGSCDWRCILHPSSFRFIIMNQQNESYRQDLYMSIGVMKDILLVPILTIFLFFLFLVSFSFFWGSPRIYFWICKIWNSLWIKKFVVYDESRNRELKIRLMNEGRCDERLKPRVEESTYLTYTGFHDKTN